MKTAIDLLIALDHDLLEIIGLSLRVSLAALGISIVIGVPLGAFLGAYSFFGRNFVMGTLNALMGLPPVVVGVLVYLYLSRSGPFGWMGLLYTPWAMIIAQVILIIPIIAALCAQIIEDLNTEYKTLFRSLGLGQHRVVTALVYDARYSLLTVILAGFGRAISEVGAVIIVGGNIDHLTRVMTTAIALETSKGDLAMALALGFILLAIALLVNTIASSTKAYVKKRAYE